MKKKVLSLVLITGLIMGLTACATKPADKTKEKKKESTEKSEVGTLSEDGTFKAADGSYSICLPEGWTLDKESTSDLVSFTSDKKDIIEIVSLSGEDVKGSLEVFPATAEEYNATKLKDAPAKEITKYNILKDSETGVETFQIYCKYEKGEKNPYTFTALSGIQDQEVGKYYAANAMIQSEGKEEEVATVIDSFAVLNLE
ncbi:MAG: hypothetical protein RR920_01405 [Lachnospiraceae bacterium]